MAKLLARVFQYDVTVCPTCAGRMKTIAALAASSAIEAILNVVDLPSRAPPIAPSRLDRQLEFDELACIQAGFSRYSFAHAPGGCRNATASARRRIVVSKGIIVSLVFPVRAISAVCGTCL